MSARQEQTAVSSPAADYHAYVDARTPRHVAGWARNAIDPAEHPEDAVMLTHTNESMARRCADLFLRGLHDIGVGDGTNGVCTKLPRTLSAPDAVLGSVTTGRICPKSVTHAGSTDSPEATLSNNIPAAAPVEAQMRRASGLPANRGPGQGTHQAVAILLSAHNGELFLQEQLDSLTRQTHPRWTLFWRDDGSSDAALAILQRFETLAGEGKSRFVARSGALGATNSYLTLLASAWHEQFQYFAFADQDNVWFDDKIERGLAALADVPPDLPALYCARQELVDELLRYLGKSPALVREPGFPTALTQNIATGCTILLNRAAVEVALSIRAPENTLHDWWCYIAVSAAGGRIVSDASTVLQYRQHAGNLVGSPLGTLRRGVAALRRGPGPFMAMFRGHVAALQAHSDLLSDRARGDLSIISTALTGGLLDKLRALGLPGFRRQTWPEDLVFRIWFLLG